MGVDILSKSFRGKIAHPNELFPLYGKEIQAIVCPTIGIDLQEQQTIEHLFYTSWKAGYIIQSDGVSFELIDSKINYESFNKLTNLYLLSFNTHEYLDSEYYLALPLTYYNVLVPGQMPMNSISCMLKTASSVSKYLAYAKLKYNVSGMLDMLSDKKCAVAIRIKKKDIKGL